MNPREYNLRGRDFKFIGEVGDKRRNRTESSKEWPLKLPPFLTPAEML